MTNHGTYAAYTVEHCRCDACRRANADYERRRGRRKAYGTFPWTGPDRSRVRIEELLGRGCPLRSIARASGISRSTLKNILHGKRGPDGTLRPVARVHESTESRLLSVEPSDARSPATVSATPAWIQLREMIEFGFPKSRIALALGKKTPALQISPQEITRENANAVDQLHWNLWRNHPPFRAVCRCPLPRYLHDSLDVAGS